MNQRAELNLSENCVLADAISESTDGRNEGQSWHGMPRGNTLVVSRSWKPLSTLLLSFAHLAKWS